MIQYLFSNFISINSTQAVWRKCTSLKDSSRFFIKTHSDDLTKLKFHDTTSHLTDDDLCVGDSTTALYVHLSDSDVKQFYQRFIQNQLKKFDFKLQILDPVK